MTRATSAIHASILCVDVENFGDRRRTDQDQATVRAGLYEAIEQALSASGVPWSRCQCEDRGDGFLVLVPADVSKSSLVTIFPRALAEALTRHNRAHGPPARIKLRVALHAGEVRHDAHGVVGRPVILAFRLLNADVVKSALRGSSGILVLVASERFFEEVIRHEPAAAPDAYRRVHVAVKETTEDAWVCLPDQIEAPRARPTRLEPAPPPATNVPRQLPATVPDFVGREDELATLTKLLDESAGRRAAVQIAVISGPAGVGKTALAVEWARQVRDRFPDGDLYINLRGDDPVPSVPPGDALDLMLRGLEVDAAKIPAEIEEKAARYRSQLDARRMLIMLDNAADAAQLRWLLPGAPGCLVVVTSRSNLQGFIARHGAHHIRLGRLTEAEAVALLKEIIGVPEVEAELAAATTIARRCDLLPLALRIAAVRAATSAHTSLANVADELSGERTRLDILDTDDEYTGVRTAFSWSYRALPAPAARTFRLLGLHRGPDVSLDVIAALIDASPAEARRSLDTLTSKNLAEETQRNRFRLHDLMRCYAEERARNEETEQERTSAVRRMLVWYLHTAADANRELFSLSGVNFTLADAPRRPRTFSTSNEAQRWCETERLNLIAAIHHAAEAGHHDIVWRLVLGANGFLYLLRYRADWTTAHELGLESARLLGDRIGEGYVLRSLGFGYQDYQFDKSIAYYRRALEIFRETRHRPGQGWAILGIGHATRGLRDFDGSIAHYEEALNLFRETRNSLGQSLAHLGLGYSYGGLRQFEKSIRCFQRAIQFVGGDRRTEGWALHGLGYGYRGLHRFEKAIDHYQQALSIFQEVGDLWGQGEALYNLGKAQADAGRHDQAHRSWTDALAIFEDLHVDRGTEIRARLDNCVAVSL